MRKSSKRLLIATAIAATLALAGCSSSAPTTSASAGTVKTGDLLNVGVLLVPTQWDPAKFDWTQQIQVQQAAYDTLIHIQPDGTFAPGLALSWKYETPTKFTMTLRKGVKFADGTAFNSSVVKQNIDHERATTGPRTLQVGTISDVETNGDYGVTVNLSQPMSDLPLIFGMAMGMMASPAALNAGTLATKPVGSGPYTLDTSQTVVNDHYTFVKNPDYWDAKDIHWKTIVFKLITDYTASVNALRSGQIAMALGQPTTVSAAQSGGATVITTPGAVVSLDLQDRAGTVVPALGDVKVRQAINLAIDRKAISASLLPGRPTSQLFAKGTSAYDPKLDDTYALNLKKAQALMAQTQYANGFDLPILSFPLNDPALQVVQSDLAKIKINVKINSVPIANYITLRASTQTAAWIAQLSSTGSSYLDSLNVLLPTGLFNPFKSTDPTITKDLDAANKASAANLGTAWKAVSKAVQDQAWFAPIDQINTYYYYNAKQVSGVQGTSGQTVPFIYTWAPPK